MTEWTMDLAMPPTEAAGGDAPEGAPPPEVTAWPELGTGLFIEDAELDQTDWFA